MHCVCVPCISAVVVTQGHNAVLGGLYHELKHKVN